MAEPAESSAGPVRSNPLYHDPVLLQMYVEALDDVLAEAEVRAALEEFDLIPATVRNKMVSEAALVLGSAPQEYEDYRQAASSEVSRSYTLPWPSRDPRAPTRAVRQLWVITAALGALITACGITVLITGPLAQPWLSVGITVITVAAAVWSARLALGTRFAADLFSGRIDAGHPSLAEARRDLMAAVGGTELLALVRTNIDTYSPAPVWAGVHAREKDLAAQARMHLARVRYLQTYTSGWSGTVHLPGGAVEGQRSRSVARAEQPLSYPEIVDDFRRFAQVVAEEAHRRGDRVFIGVDELDKIGTPGQAERFLNEIKGIFGIPHVYFMVSVSDDALTSFERRGLPLRDAFDSSFDEMIHVRPLSYAESRRLLYRRVIGLTESYVALCHCLSGGLARDLIRTARQVVRAAAGPADRAPTLGVISTAVVQDELRRKLTAITQAIREAAPGDVMDLQLTVHECARHLMPGQAVLTIVDTMTRVDGEEPVAVARLRIEFAAFAYFCATVQEIFTDELGSERMIEATGSSGDPGSFDALVAARNAMALDTLLSWRLTSEFRKQWQLETRELIKVTADTKRAELPVSSLGPAGSAVNPRHCVARAAGNWRRDRMASLR